MTLTHIILTFLVFSTSCLAVPISRAIPPEKAESTLSKLSPTTSLAVHAIVVVGCVIFIISELHRLLRRIVPQYDKNKLKSAAPGGKSLIVLCAIGVNLAITWAVVIYAFTRGPEWFKVFFMSRQFVAYYLFSLNMCLTLGLTFIILVQIKRISDSVPELQAMQDWPPAFTGSRPSSDNIASLEEVRALLKSEV